MVDHFLEATHGDVGMKKKRYHRNKKLKKINKMVCAGNYISGKNDKEVQNNSKKVMKKTFYYNFYNDDNNIKNHNLKELKPLFDDETIDMIKIDESGFKKINTYIGAKMMHDNYPVFLLVPRLEAIKINNNSRADYDSLMWLLDNHSNVRTRGKVNSGFSEQYATAGAHCSNFRKGIHIKKLHGDVNQLYEPYFQKWLRRAKNFAIQYLPFGLLSGLHEAKFLVDDNVCYEKQLYRDNDLTNLNNSLYASLATAYNYIAPAHVDKDSFLSCLFVTLDMEQLNGHKKYLEKMEICVYFSFPDYNKTVALRPGDVLFFNPLKKHCVSQRCIKYIDNQVLCTTFYINTKTMSGNDATKPVNLNKVM
jgi:hypothetical protein